MRVANLFLLNSRKYLYVGRTSKLAERLGTMQDR